MPLQVRVIASMVASRLSIIRVDASDSQKIEAVCSELSSNLVKTETFQSGQMSSKVQNRTPDFEDITCSMIIDIMMMGSRNTGGDPEHCVPVNIQVQC